MKEEKYRKYLQSAFTLLIILSLLFVPAGSLFAQQDRPSTGDSSPADSATGATFAYPPDMLSYYREESERVRRMEEALDPLPEVTQSISKYASRYASQNTGIEPDAGSWRPWVIESVDDLLPGRPPTVAATRAEIDQLKELAKDRDEAALAQIAYWNAGPPSYRWNRIAMDEMLERALPFAFATRILSNMHAGIFDATVAAWNGKYAYNRARPSDFDPSLETVLPNPTSPAYPSEYAAVGAVAAAVLSTVFPEEAAHFAELAEASAYSRLLAGVEYPSDIEAGRILGEAVAEQVIARLAADGSDAPFTGTIPTEEGKWTGENAVTPTYGTWATWALTSPYQYRPAPPPAWDSEQMAAEMQELRDFERTPIAISIAQFWEYGSGGRRNYWFWNQILDRLVLEAGLTNNQPRAARAYALPNISTYEAGVACWDAKFAYYGIRPFQLDPEFVTLFPTPNHPSYPSAHSCISVAFADMLAVLFPMAADEVNALANEAAESRIWSGIHFRSDVTAGIELGHVVAATVLARASSDGSQSE